MVRPDSVICIVDDDEEVLESIVTFFRSAGVRVRKFGAAENLLSSPDLAPMTFLITDLHMPGMSGLELLNELRRKGISVPVIVVTAYLTAAARKAGQALGVSAFVTKPADPEALLEKVAALMNDAREARK